MTNALPPVSRASRRKKVIAGAAVGVLAVGFWLGTLFNGWGFGTGKEGEGAGDADTGGASATSGPEDLSVDLGNPSLTRPDVPPEPAPAAVPAQPAPLVAVLVKGDGYGLLSDSQAKVAELATPLSQHFSSATLEDVVSAAQAATGNADGVKVLIVKHKSSTVGRDGELKAALRSAGLPDGAIHVYTGSHE
jgi:hypothetical protein